MDSKKSHGERIYKYLKLIQRIYIYIYLCACSRKVKYLNLEIK